MKILHSALCCFILIGLFACQKKSSLDEGMWRVELSPDTIQPEIILPFNIEFNKGENGDWSAFIINADERILVEDILETDDSLVIKLPVFEGIIETKKTAQGFEGSYTHKAAGRSWSIPALIEKGSQRFELPLKEALFDPSGKWKVIVNPDTPQEEVQIGEFNLTDSKLVGTFLTLLGDYRYLEGMVSGDQFRLSCFDGAHSLLFSAKLNENGNLEDGFFIGGPNWSGTWRAERNREIELPDASTLTYLKPGFEQLEFTFPDLNGKMVSLSDAQFENKAKIVQIIGSWCPNCMDETRYFASLHDRYNKDGLEIIALCYESDNVEQSVKAIERFKSGTGAKYTFLYAGVSNKQLAAQTLPMLNKIISYPTSIFIDRNNKIRKIYTGFSGPGTGEHFKNLSLEIEKIIAEML
jgi:thiol-disulfide isomerase/thioredoxin